MGNVPPYRGKCAQHLGLNIGNLVDLMTGNTLVAKYSYLGSPVVKVQINDISLPNTLIDLGASINVMTKLTMEGLGLTNL